MNGTTSLYTIEKDGAIMLVQDGNTLDRRFDEVREVFLGERGSDYAYFAKPLGENTYCFLSQYRGNLCGLTGYMNPRKNSNNSAVIFAGLKDGNWNIYSNSSLVVKNTGYTSQSVDRDYAFYDVDAPRYYMFINYTPT